MAGHNLSFAPWLPREYTGLSEATSPMMTQALRARDGINGLLSLAPSISQLASFVGFLWFSPGEQVAFFGPWASEGETYCGKFLENGRLLPLQTLTERYRSFSMDFFWRYKELHHFFSTCRCSFWAVTTLTQLERLFVADEPIPHMISELYKLLILASPTIKPAVIRE